MKRFLLMITLLSLFAGACVPDEEQFDRASTYKPMLMTRDQLRESVAFEDKRDLVQPGKIYFKDNYIFITERYTGVHIIDNTDNKNPLKIGFIRVPGCVDMAVKNNILYVDNAVDLVSIDISDVNNPQVVNRIESVFPEMSPPDGGILEPKYRIENRPENTVVIGWIKN